VLTHLSADEVSRIEQPGYVSNERAKIVRNSGDLPPAFVEEISVDGKVELEGSGLRAVVAKEEDRGLWVYAPADQCQKLHALLGEPPVSEIQNASLRSLVNFLRNLAYGRMLGARERGRLSGPAGVGRVALLISLVTVG